VTSFAMLMLVSVHGSQTPPDLSGTWTLDVPAPAAGPGGGRGGGREGGGGGGREGGGRGTSPSLGSGWPATITLAQDASSLTLRYQGFGRGDMQPPTRLVYKLDGTESRNTVNIGRGPQEEVAKATWSGATLVITSTQRFTNPQTGQPATFETRRVLTLESPASLVVETSYSGVMGGEPLVSKTTYKKG